MATSKDKSRKDSDSGATASTARELSDRELEGVVGGVTAEPAPIPIGGIDPGDLEFGSK
jgi:hypothetical protein